ncbi:hypothetical protein Q2K19_18865 [Micromonospora soli]|uniref:hypothetical protein n=1 Tax=Micromonospora sp. NBRC 110009 TaxID=3061627 RepID=UPI00267411DD|nr:hypothetical protein [Micromonospora sp. NBRC 110009]WKT96286.1 hypothetical protein Q2K19_18865 [Micromonospora sp. NBRC 110009]
MAHGEAEHGCAQGEPCRPGHHEQPASAKQPRRTGLTHSAEPTVGRGEDTPPVPRQRAAEPVVPAAPEPDPDPAQGCRSDLPGWAGAHRHGAVRPRNRTLRRERPPRRWC